MRKALSSQGCIDKTLSHVAQGEPRGAQDGPRCSYDNRLDLSYVKDNDTVNITINLSDLVKSTVINISRLM